MCGASGSFRTGELSYPGGHEQSHGVGDFMTCLETGWFGCVGESDVIRQWKGKLAPDMKV